MVRKAFVIAALLASPAHAQNTTCQWFGSIWSCQGNPGPQSSSNSVDYGALPRQLEQQNERNQQTWDNINRQRQERRQAELAASYARAQAQMQQESQSWLDGVRKEVGARLAKGDCAGAQSFALSSGQIYLANQAKAYCASPPPPAK